MDGNMRRLPPWMLAGASSGVTDTSNRKDNKISERKRKDEPEAPKKRQRRTAKVEERDDDSEEPKKVEMRRRGGDRVRSKTKEEEKAKPSVGRNGTSPEIIQSVTGPEEEEEDLTVDDLLSFAQEYVKGEQDQTRKKRESLSASEPMVDVSDESNMRSFQGETYGTRDPTTEDMLNLLLGPLFKKSQH